MKQIEPVRGSVLVLTITPPKEVISAGGIHLSEAASQEVEETCSRAKVVAIGDLNITDGGVEMPVNYKVGDTIFYYKYIGKYMGKSEEDKRELSESYLMLSMSEILGKELH